MKYWILLAAAALVVPFLIRTAITQPPPGERPPPRRGVDRPPPGGPLGGLDRALEKLKLSGKQKAKVGEIVEAQHEKLRSLFDENQEKLLQTLKGVLDQEQRKQLEQTLRDRRPGWDAPGRLEQLLDALRLTDKQKPKIEEIVEAHHEKMRSSSEQIIEQLLKQLKSSVNAEQLKQLTEALDRRPPGPPEPPGRPGRARGVPADDLVERVMAYDKNKDGKVTRDELPERMHYLFEPGDTNKDGALDREELQALAAKQDRPEAARPRRPPPGGPPPGGLEQALDELQLTEKEKTRADEILRAHHAKMRRLFEQSRKELLEQMKEALGEEQAKKFEKSLDSQRPGGFPPPPPPGRRGGRDGPPPPPPPPNG